MAQRYESGKKLWKVKVEEKPPPEPQDVQLDCGCSCTECRTNYSLLLAEYASKKGMQKIIDDQQEMLAANTTEIMRIQTKKDVEIEDLATRLAVEQKRGSELEDKLKEERTLRIEELYKRELQRIDTAEVDHNLRSLREQNQHIYIELQASNEENKVLNESYLSLSESNRTACEQLQLYEIEIARLEALNNDLRWRLSKTDGEAGLLRQQNNSLQLRAGPTEKRSNTVTNSSNGNRVAGIRAGVFSRGHQSSLQQISYCSSSTRSSLVGISSAASLPPIRMVVGQEINKYKTTKSFNKR